MALYQIGDTAPRIADSAWIADSAQIIGRVEMAADSSAWFGAVLRGDTENIRIGVGSNVQDGSVVHADPGFPATIGDHVTVGHLVMLHGCTVGDNTLIGMQAVVLNGAKIGRNCIVGAGALIAAGKVFPDNSLIVGSPARVLREVSPEQVEDIRRGSEHYVANARRFRADCKRIG
ncbi:MAG: gamma carbonic anhydrase family protein [Burkholderiaceae bacterium]|nr:gamma carbonic anhydrase family protein [Burkholderiaceae bacterium]